MMFASEPRLAEAKQLDGARMQREQTANKFVGATVAIIIFLAGQAAGLIWVLSSLVAQVSFLSSQMIEVRASIEKGVDDRYRARDAARDHASIQAAFNSRFDLIMGRVEANARRMDTIEGKKP